MDDVELRVVPRSIDHQAVLRQAEQRDRGVDLGPACLDRCPGDIHRQDDVHASVPGMEVAEFAAAQKRVVVPKREALP